MLTAGILVMAGFVALLLLAVNHRLHSGGSDMRTVPTMAQPDAHGLDADARRGSAQSQPDDAEDMVKRGDDAATEEAKRVLRHEQGRLESTAPSTSTVGPDGRIHLRGGGSITPEQWDDANRHLQDSPVMHDPLPPPPVN